MPTFDVEDTIVAVASPPGNALRGIVRISGPDTIRCLAPICLDPDSLKPCLNHDFDSRTALNCKLALNAQSVLPGRLLIWPDDRSFTRQPAAEFHCIGSPPLLEMATAAICNAGARLAERGEFTLRAFLSGRIDLTQAEAVLAVIDAESSDQLNSALLQLSGGLAGPLTTLRNTLVGILAELEAGLDFVEEDIEFISRTELETRLLESSQLLSELNRQIQQRNLSHDAYQVALSGAPNTGKSSLFNALLNRQHAIVSDVEGTTRDFITATTTWEEINFQLIDTAGIDNPHLPNPTSADMETRAQTQTQRRLKQADLIIGCIPAIRSSDELQTILRLLDSHSHTDTLIVVTMADLASSEELDVLKNRIGKVLDLPADSQQPIVTSSTRETGIEHLKSAIVERVSRIRYNTGSFVSATATRAAASLVSAEFSVGAALDAVRADLGLEIVAAELRQSLYELGTVVGTVYTDDILDQVFSRFCIGK